MVTIEQKIILFSRLIYQIMNANFKEVLQNLESEHDKRFEESKRDIDMQVKKIISSAHKKRDLEISKINGTLKINEKREHMLEKEKYYDKFMAKLEAYIKEFVKGEAYKDYMLKLINGIGLKDSEIKNLNLFMTKDDYSKYSDLLSNELKKLGYKEENYKIEITNQDIIGGFVLEDNINNFKVDLSIRSLLEENQDYIMKVLFEALERVK